MGKASTTTTPSPTPTPPPTAEMKRKKKKGRPTLTDLRQRQLQKQQTIPNKNNLTPSPSPPVNYDSTPSRRSTRRNPNFTSNSPPPFEEEDDDDERKQKKVKLVVRLPQSNHLNQQQQQVQNSQHSESASGEEDSDGDLDLGGDDNQVESPKKRKINSADCRSDDAASLQGEKPSKATDTLNGMELDSGPTTTLPDKKLLLFILDRLQKKDTYGVFSEPVDPNELPDYHEIIEHPMDFGTVRKKLDGGIYSNLEELEADVLLICSNAMQYNAPDTVYFRQARTIQELAKRDFANLRNEGDDGEPQPKVVRRGRPPSKILKKPLESSPVDRIGPELSSCATLATAEDKAASSNSYGLRKGPALYRYRSSDAFVTPQRSRYGESDWSIDWSNEFPAHILRADMKYGKKNFIVDENKRDTYRQYQASGSENELSTLSNIDGDMKRLMAVGLHFERHAYARSLAKFAAELGPVAWKIASKKIETVLPAGVKFGPGWVGENEVHSAMSSVSAEKQKSPSNVGSDRHSSRPTTPSAPGVSSSVQSRPSEEMVEAVRRLNSQNELAVQGTSPWGIPGSTFPAQQKSALYPKRNGFNGMIGYSLSQLGMGGTAMPLGQSGLVEGSMPSHILDMVSRNDASSISKHPDVEESKPLQSWVAARSGNLSDRGKAPDPTVESEASISGKSSYQELSAQHRQPLPIPPDLNVKVQAPSSPSSSLRIGSPQQPDLALQL